MGLIKAFTTSTSGVLGDQFKEYVTCPTGQRRISTKRNYKSWQREYQS